MLGVLLLLLWSSAHARHDPHPYLLIGGDKYVYKVNTDGSNFEHLVHVVTGGVMSVDFHYRLNYLFWTNVKLATVNRARLSDGEYPTVIARRDLSKPVGLAVDWMRDKLYWADQELHKIEEYDIINGTRRMLFNDMSNPWGLALDPRSGWLYWADRESHRIERINVTSMTDRVDVHVTFLPCTLALTINYDTHSLYWVDYCMYRIESSNMDGAARSVVVPSGVYFSSGITVFNGTVYWTQSSPMAVLAMEPGENQPRRMVYQDVSSTKLLFDVKVVHPLRQFLPPEAYAGDCEYFHNCNSSELPSPSLTPNTLQPSPTTTLPTHSVELDSHIKKGSVFHDQKGATVGVNSHGQEHAAKSASLFSAAVKTSIATELNSDLPSLPVLVSKSLQPRASNSPSVGLVTTSTTTPAMPSASLLTSLVASSVLPTEILSSAFSADTPPTQFTPAILYPTPSYVDASRNKPSLASGVSESLLVLRSVLPEDHTPPPDERISVTTVTVTITVTITTTITVTVTPTQSSLALFSSALPVVERTDTITVTLTATVSSTLTITLAPTRTAVSSLSTVYHHPSTSVRLTSSNVPPTASQPSPSNIPSIDDAQSLTPRAQTTTVYTTVYASPLPSNSLVSTATITPSAVFIPSESSTSYPSSVHTSALTSSLSKATVFPPSMTLSPSEPVASTLTSVVPSESPSLSPTPLLALSTRSTVLTHLQHTSSVFGDVPTASHSNGTSPESTSVLSVVASVVNTSHLNTDSGLTVTITPSVIITTDEEKGKVNSALITVSYSVAAVLVVSIGVIVIVLLILRTKQQRKVLVTDDRRDSMTPDQRQRERLKSYKKRRSIVKQYGRRSRSNAESYYDRRRASIYRYNRRRSSLSPYARRRSSVNPYDRRRSSIHPFDRRRSSIHLLRYRPRPSISPRYNRRKSLTKHYNNRRRSQYSSNDDNNLKWSMYAYVNRRRSSVTPHYMNERRSSSVKFCYLPRTMDTSDPDLDPISPISSYHSPFENPRISANEQ